MGEPILRLNPKIESRTKKDFLVLAIKLILSVVMLLNEKEYKKRGKKPYDYRIILGLNILRVLFCKNYSDYEIEMRGDVRFCKAFNMSVLPGKSTLQRGMSLISPKLLREFNFILLSDFVKMKLNLLVDASGISIIGKSIWFCLRLKQRLTKKDCDKIHIVACSDVLFVMNWRITKGKKHDCPFFTILLKPFKILGIILSDKGYLSRKNFQFVYDKKGALFAPFKINSTASPKSHPAWKFAFNLWKKFNISYMNIYHQRSKIEAIFHALKERYGDKLYGKSARARRKEMAFRFIAYNMRLLIYFRYANENKINLWVRAKKN